jgi:Flp pilus assembly protein TadG
MNKIRNYWKNRKGMTLVWGAFFLVLLLMLAGMAIDIGYMYFVKNQLQVAADSAALAGAGLLSGDPTDFSQSGARTEALTFASKNTAAGTPVVLADGGAGNNTLSNGNDITVGSWDPTTRTYTAGVYPANAVEVRPRRTADSPGGSVSVFLGQIFRMIGADWSLMSASARAIAARPPRPSTGLVICEPACTSGIDLSKPFMFNQQSTDPSKTFYSISYTQFQPNPPVGSASCLNNPNVCDNGLKDTCATADNTTVASYIWQERIAPVSCDPIRWDNGEAGVRFDVKCAFSSSTFDTANKTDAAGNTPPAGPVATWKVIVPVSQDCPSGTNPGGTSPVLTYMAEIEIEDVVNASGNSVITGGGTPAGIKIRSIDCFPCGDWSRLGHIPVLVK